MHPGTKHFASFRVNSAKCLVPAQYNQYFTSSYEITAAIMAERNYLHWSLPNSTESHHTVNLHFGRVHFRIASLWGVGNTDVETEIPETFHNNIIFEFSISNYFLYFLLAMHYALHIGESKTG